MLAKSRKHRLERTPRLGGDVSRGSECITPDLKELRSAWPGAPAEPSIRPVFTRLRIEDFDAAAFAAEHEPLLGDPFACFQHLATEARALSERSAGASGAHELSLIAFQPEQVWTFSEHDVHVVHRGGRSERRPHGGDPLGAMRRHLEARRLVPHPELPPFQGGFVGSFAFEAARFFERVPRFRDEPLLADRCFARFAFYDRYLVHAHQTGDVFVVENVPVGGRAEEREARERLARWEALLRSRPARLDWRPSGAEPLGALEGTQPREGYKAAVRRVREYLAAGDIFQAVLSQRFTRRTAVAPLTAYRRLRRASPSRYGYALRDGKRCLVGVSPETLVRTGPEGEMIMLPLAGTRRREQDPRLNLERERELRESPKENAEHLMLVDLARNDVGRVCRAGTVSVPRLQYIEHYSHVMHMASEIVGRLRPDHDMFDAFRASFPAGTMTGAPKIRAMQIIAELEPHDRDFFSGATGYFSGTGHLDFAITIRSVLFRDGVAHLQAGAGIVIDSDPAHEYDECCRKVSACASVLEP